MSAMGESGHCGRDAQRQCSSVKACPCGQEVMAEQLDASAS